MEMPHGIYRYAILGYPFQSTLLACLLLNFCLELNTGRSGPWPDSFDLLSSHEKESLAKLVCQSNVFLYLNRFLKILSLNGMQQGHRLSLKWQWHGDSLLLQQKCSVSHNGACPQYQMYKHRTKIIPIPKIHGLCKYLIYLLCYQE